MLKKEPVRLCVACRERKTKKNLIRIVKTKTGEVFVDLSQKLQGRGAYLCFKKECLDVFEKKKFWTGVLDVKLVKNFIAV